MSCFRVLVNFRRLTQHASVDLSKKLPLKVFKKGVKSARITKLVHANEFLKTEKED